MTVQCINDIEESIDAVIIIGPDRDEGNRDSTRNTDGVLDVKVLMGTEDQYFYKPREGIKGYTHGFNSSLACTLGVLSTIQSLQGERGAGGKIGSEGGQEGPQIRLLCPRSEIGKTSKDERMRTLANCPIKPETPSLFDACVALVVGIP